jgi:hypothetical protein
VLLPLVQRVLLQEQLQEQLLQRQAEKMAEGLYMLQALEYQLL